MVALIWAMDRHRLIGKNQDLPWYYPEDLKYFKAMTLNKTVLMGRSTFDSIMKRNGKPLPHRKNVVLSHQKSVHPDVETIQDIKKYINTHPDEEIFIIGGKSVFEQTIAFADKLYMTVINKSYDGDIFLSEFPMDGFSLVSKTDSNDLSFCIYERKY
jgi:dihydrofolate reductase